MKMKFIHRLLLALYAFIWLLGLAMAALFKFAPGVFQSLIGLVEPLTDIAFVPYIAAGIMAIWSLGMFLLAFKRENKKLTRQVALKTSEDGAVNVSVEALDTLVKEAIGQNDEILEIRSQVVNHQDSITVQVRMVLSTTAHIPNVTMLMQRNIKRFIEEFSGIAVREVTITVTEVRSPDAVSGKRALKKGKQRKTIVAPAAAALPEKQPAEAEKASIPATEPVIPVPEEPVREEPTCAEPTQPCAAEEPTVCYEEPADTAESPVSPDGIEPHEAALEENESLPFECFVHEDNEDQPS